MNTSNLSNLPVAKPIGPDRNLVDIPITPNTPIVTEAIIVESVMELNPKMIRFMNWVADYNLIERGHVLKMILTQEKIYFGKENT